MEVLTKIKNGNTMRPRKSSPEYFPEGEKTQIPTDVCTLMLIAALFTIAKIYKLLSASPIDEQVKKLYHVYTMGYYLTIKKKKK